MSKNRFYRVICLSVILFFMVFFLMLFVGESVSQSKLTQKAQPQYGGTLTITDKAAQPVIGYPPKMLRPTTIREAAPALETLMRNDKGGRPTPWLATQVKEDPRTMTITLTLRKGVKFHDDTDFNAYAVKWNLEQSISEKSGGTANIKSIDVINDSTVRINLTSWDSTFTANLAQNTGLMISPTAFKKNGENWCRNNPVGTGPFQFVSRQQGVRTSYKKFDGYWQKGKPYLDKIEFVFIPDTMSREFSLQKGETDIMVTDATMNLKTLEKEGYIVNRRKLPAGARSYVFDSGNSRSPFADVRVRQAVQYAVDAKAINNALFDGIHEPANQQAYKGNWAYNPSVVGYPYNPAKAKQLLTAAGYPNGFKTKITYYTSPENDQVCAAIQNYLKEVGIEAELVPLTSARWSEVANGGTWEGMIAAENANIDVLAMMNEMYTGRGKFLQMLTPSDYLAAIRNGVEAKDFKTKQKWTWETMKLITDKHALFLHLYILSSIRVNHPYVHNHEFMEASTAWWTPEDAWKSK